MGRTLRRAAALSLALALTFCCTGCGSARKNTVTYYTYFDTVTTITYYGPAREFDELCAVAEDMMDRYNRACDIYHEYSGVNNACTLNKNAGKGPVAVMEELLEVLTFGKRMHEETGGMCNIAMGSVFSLWHDCRETAIAGGAA
ncbi:MAG: FAD:protein FMN transferase, partial [Oscillospiraceae bacterium]|nr:FAD:protein FMN transferase [Oscillospiraceae bacterium]